MKKWNWKSLSCVRSSTLAWKIPRAEEPGRLRPLGVAKSRTRLSDFPFTFYFHALEKEMATHSSVLAWRIPGTGEPGGLPSMGSHRVGHDWSGLAAAGKEKDNLSTLWSPLLHISRSDVFMHMAALGNCQDVCPSSAAINRNPIVSILPLMMTSKGKKKKGTASRQTESVATAWKR